MEGDERRPRGVTLVSGGEAPEARGLPAASRVGRVRLRVADLGRSLAYYREVLGLAELERAEGVARLGPEGGAPLVELHERRGVAPPPRRGRLGLYHFALLLPDRAALGRFVGHLEEAGVRAGAADHLVSEALYLWDPDGLGIEVYADRPREEWGRRDGEIAMDTLQLDVEDLAAAAGGAPWTGLPAGTVIGHVHLHVGDLVEAAALYQRALGLDLTVWSYPGALFFAAGGYHHHLGVNTWAGPRATPADEGEARLLEWELVLPDGAAVERAAASLAEAGYAVVREGGGAAVITDPWETPMRLRAEG